MRCVHCKLTFLVWCHWRVLLRCVCEVCVHCKLTLCCGVIEEFLLRSVHCKITSVLWRGACSWRTTSPSSLPSTSACCWGRTGTSTWSLPAPSPWASLLSYAGRDSNCCISQHRPATVTDAVPLVCPCLVSFVLFCL